MIWVLVLMMFIEVYENESVVFKNEPKVILFRSAFKALDYENSF